MRKRIHIIVMLAGAALALAACGNAIGEAENVPSLTTRATTTASEAASTSGTTTSGTAAPSDVTSADKTTTTTTTAASDKTTTTPSTTTSTAPTTTSATTTKLSFTPVSGKTVYAVQQTELRSEPSTNSSIIWYVEPKDKMSVISVSSDKAWYRVEHNGAEGYVAVKMTSESAPATTTTTTTTTTATTTAAPVEPTDSFTALSKTVYAVGYVELFAEPATGSIIHWYIDPGEAITVTAVSSDKAWYRVEHNGAEGYVSAAKTSETAQGAENTEDPAAEETPEQKDPS